MLKYGPTINIAIVELMNVPNRSIPLGSPPKNAPETPNNANMIPMSVVTTTEMTKTMIISPI
jgi:hypothetical protein